MRKWMLISVLALGLWLFFMPVHALAGMTVNTTQTSPSYAAKHGETIGLVATIAFDDGKAYYMDMEIKDPNGAVVNTIQLTATGYSWAFGWNWQIANTPETSQRFSITVKAYDQDNHSSLIYSDSKLYQIQINHDPLTDWVTTLEPTCTVEGTRMKRCTICDTVAATETIAPNGHTYVIEIIPATCTLRSIRKEVCSVCGYVKSSQFGSFYLAPHTPGAFTVTTPATCSGDGTETQTCTVCAKVLNTRSIPATGLHTPGSWVVTTPATATEDGTETQNCTVCSKVLGTRSIPANNTPVHVHTPGDWVVTTPATCSKEGTESQSCTTCNKALGTRSIPATGIHTPGSWVVTTPATCGDDGLETQSCTVCGKILSTRSIPATGLHTPNGNWAHISGAKGTDSCHAGACSVCGAQMEEMCVFRDVVTPPTCTEDGYTTHTCTLCGFTYTDSTVTAAGHTPGEWEVTIEATNKKQGLRVLRCAVCGEIIESQKIVRKSEWWRDNTACAFGTRIRDENPELTDKWYMLATVDITKDGVQDFPLIASNAYVVGTVYATVKNGTVAVIYELTSDKAVVKEEFLTYFQGFDQVVTVEPEELSAQAIPIGEPVQMEELFPGSDSVLVFLRLKLDYDIYADGVKRFYEGQDK